MQQKLILYIGNKAIFDEDDRVDQFKDESISFTQTIQNVKDIKKIFTEFTKTFALPASKKNNKLFKHYYNFDITASNSFDARVKVNAALEINDIPFKTGKIALTGVELKNNIPHTYKVTFYGNTVDLKDILGDDQLSSLNDLSNLDLDYDFNTVKDKIQNTTYSSDIICPLITHSARLTYSSSFTDEQLNNLYFLNGRNDNGVLFTELKYALKLQRIIDAIQTQYPITFSNDFFNNSSNTDWDYLYMWLHRKKGNVTPTEQVDIIWTTLTDLQLNAATCTSATGACIENAENLGNGVIYLNPNVSGVYRLDWTGITITPALGDTTVYSARVLMTQNGVQTVVDQFINQTGTQILGNVFGGTIPPFNSDAQYVIQTSTDPTTSITIPINGIVFTVQYRQLQEQGEEYTFQQFRNPSAFTNSNTIEFNIQEQIPKMKILDFLTGVFQMFNLTAFVENDIIVVKKLDDYYNSVGTDSDGNINSVNIDEYLDVTKSVVDIALPFKEVNFRYKGLKTFLAQQYEQVNNGGWGSLSFSLNDYFDAPQQKYSIEVPFEHLMYERLINGSTLTATKIQYGYFVDDNQEPYFGEPLIFYAYRRTIAEAATNWALKSNLTSIERIQTYWIPMNTKDINSSTSKTSLHFNTELSEYKAYVDGTDARNFTDTLFNVYYNTYLTEMFQPNIRLTKVSAYLPYKIFRNLELNQRIRFRQQNYKINSMTTNLTTGKTEFELLNSDL